MKKAKKFLIFSLILILAIVIVLVVGKQPESNQPINPNQESESNSEIEGKTIDEIIDENDEIKEIKKYLVLGIDRSGEAVPTGSLAGGGQNDAIFVVAVNETNESFKTISINRDSVVDVTVPDIFGNVASTYKDRIALAFSYGDGAGESCTNAVRTVSNLFGGLKFDGYMAVFYDAIAPTVDALGGIEIDGSLYSGDEAYHFCRDRVGRDDDSNIARMNRQHKFLGALTKKLAEMSKKDGSVISNLLEINSSYNISDLNNGQICNIALKALKYKDLGIVTPAGTDKTVTGDDGIVFSEFTIDMQDFAHIIEENLK